MDSSEAQTDRDRETVVETTEATIVRQDAGPLEDEPVLDPATLRRWRLAVFLTVLPILLLGFSTSAIANRIVFAGWALAVAMLSLSALRKGFDAGRGRSTIVARLGIVLAIGIALFGVLVGRHREIFDLGLRATLPVDFSSTHAIASTLSAPSTWYVVAAICGVGALIAWTFDRSWRP